MDEYGNPIPGSSKEFENDEIIEPTANNCDFEWLENEFNYQHLQDETSEDKSLSESHICKIEPSPNNNIDDFFEEINSIDFSQNENVQNNDILIELLERCNNFIDTLARNIVSLEEMIVEINRNINISKKNATKANNTIVYEKKSMPKTFTKSLKNKAHLANFFKIGLSNCQRNPHLMELYKNDQLILSYNGHFILEECVERNLWNQEFKNKLEQAIHVEVLEKLKKPMLEQHYQLGIDKEIQSDPLLKNKIELEISAIEKEIDNISKTPFKDLIIQFTDSETKYDWLHIAKMTNKPDLQCRRFWNLMLKPHISRAKWTKHEDDKLIEIATNYEEKNWREIAIELNTNRNELQCFVHYQKCKKMLNKKGRWSKEEDKKLVEIIKENSVNNIINWQKVYFALHDEGRSVDQIYNRWMCCLKPGIKKGFLNEREKFIINVAQNRNLPPSVVSMNLINRTPAQIRNAYRRIAYYKQADNYVGGWTPEEDKSLLRAINPYARDELTWTQVAEQVPGRNAEQCRHRFTLIEKKVNENPKMTVENFPRTGTRRVCKVQDDDDDPNMNTLFDESYLQETFKKNRLLQKSSIKPIESNADRKLKKSFLDNIYVTNRCNFSSKCDLLKYVLDYLGADLIVPKKFIHKDDLIDDHLMSMMTYLKVYNIKTLTLEPSTTLEQNTTDIKFAYEGVHDVLKTSDIINSELSELEGLFDIRIRNFENQNSRNISQNLVPIEKKTFPLPIYSMGSVPPNFETFRMLYTYMKNLTTSIKSDRFNDSNTNYCNLDNGESKKLHDRLVAIFRWPALLSGLVDYNSENINMLVNTKHFDTNNYPKNLYYSKKKAIPYLNLKTYLQ